MKKLIAVSLSLMLSHVAHAAANFESKAIKPNEVPAAAAAAHKSTYAGAKTAWRKNTWTGAKGKETTVYVAWFFHKKFAHRAAYTPQGANYLTIRYLGGALGLPATIKTALRKAHVGYRIGSAQQISVPTANMTAYRTELRKGASKVVTWTDKDGKPIAKDNLPDAIEELGR